MPPKDDNPAANRVAESREAAAETNSFDIEAIDSLDERDEHSKAFNPRKRFELIAPVFSRAIKSFGSKTKTKGHHKTATRSKTLTQLREILAKPIAVAAERAGLDLNEELDREVLLCMLAFSIYGGKRPGRERSWDDEKLKQLHADVDATRLVNPSLQTEAQVCKHLCSRKANFPHYQVLTLRTLLRRLQDAKKVVRLEEEALKADAFLANSRAFQEA
jgi:hypothetical protein